MHALSKRCGAEFFGTFWLVLGGCGAAVLAAGVPDVGIGYAGVALAFGLTVLTMAFAVGHISGGHFNPAVTVGLLAAGVFPPGTSCPMSWPRCWAPSRRRRCWPASLRARRGSTCRPGLRRQWLWRSFSRQVLAGGGFHRRAGADRRLHLRDPGRHQQARARRIRGHSHRLALTLIHLVSIPVTNTSVNPARSTGPALFVGGWAVEQLWLFWVAPIAGAVVGAIAYRRSAGPRTSKQARRRPRCGAGLRLVAFWRDSGRRKSPLDTLIDSATFRA